MHWHWLHPLVARPGQGAAFLALAVLVALAVDRVWGEPPARWHPVVWMGQALGACGRWVAPTASTGRDLKGFWLAALFWCALAAIVLIVSALLQAAVLYVWGAPTEVCEVIIDMPGLGLEGASAVVGVLRFLLAALLLGLLLKPLFAFRLLLREVRAVEDALARSLGEGRARLAWLVSRDVTQLSADEVRQSAIESLAENLNDSVVAPLFWFAVAGLPGAAQAATGSGPANGPPTPTMCSRGCPRASLRCCWRWRAGACARVRWPARRAGRRHPTAAGPWRPWRWCWMCG